MTLPDDLRKKRLLFRSWHRGTREADLILGRFAEAHLARFDPAQLDRYEALLQCGDADIFDWVAGRAPLPAAHDHDVGRLLLAFRCMPAPIPSRFENPSPPSGGRGKGEEGVPTAGGGNHLLTPALSPKGEREKELEEDTGEALPT